MLGCKAYKRTPFILMLCIALVVLGVGVLDSSPAYAAATFTVDSTNDTSDAIPGDGVCDDGLGVCTLRAAMEEANALAGADTVEFNILPLDGTTKTIQPGSALPNITERLTIDGYTQDDATENIVVSPNPLNGILRIEIDGSLAGSAGFVIDAGADSSVVRGLVINSFAFEGIVTSATNLRVEGNYIGTDPTGLIAQGNGGFGVSCAAGGTDAIIGGLTTEVRNLISGNSSSGIFSCDNWIIQGNYLGTDITGVTQLQNLFSGILVIGVNDVTIGGTLFGAPNVISGNADQGIIASSTEGLVIQGNFIGIDYSGTASLPNVGSGITINDATDLQIGGSTVAARNIVSNNTAHGIYFDAGDDVRIQGNYIGTDITGNVAMGNAFSGIFVSVNNVDALIGGAAAGEGNLIANSSGLGINTANDPGISRIAILGNSIHSNNFMGLDLNGDGVTNNDAGDADIGVNDLLNYPVIIDTSESAGNTTINYSLDVPAGDYRIEFFSNIAADSSGNGEGENFLGFQNITSAGTGSENFSHVIAGTGIINIAATATEIDPTAPSGFGSTSEFSVTLIPFPDLDLAKSIVDPNAVAVGADIVYRFVLTNNGTGPWDISTLDASIPGANSLVLDLMPPDITYVSESSANVSCTTFGPGSAALFGPNAGQHADHEVVNCGYVGGAHVLAPGDSFTFDMTVHVQPTSDLIFTNFAFSSFVTGDPDFSDFATALGLVTPTTDLFDLVGGINDNVPASAFPLPVVPTTTVVIPAPSASGTLPTTGANVAILIPIALLLAGLGRVLTLRRIPRSGCCGLSAKSEARYN